MKNVYALALQLLFIFSASNLQGQVTLLTENFNGPSTPLGWTNINNSLGGLPGGPTAAVWTLRDDGYMYNSNFLMNLVFHSNDASRFYLTNSDAQGDDIPLPVTNTILQMPTLSTLGYTNVTLQFYHTFFAYTSADSALVEASLDGITWTKVYTANFPIEDQEIGSPTAFVLQTVNLDAYANRPAVFLRFHYWAEWGYFWAIDNVTVTASGSVVPVQLLNFSGYRAANKNILNWSTSSESNNRGFQVERSTDGVHFVQIGFVNTRAAGGNSSNTLRYSYEDLAAGTGKYFYRLRQVDIDGQSKLSNIIHLTGPLPATLSLTSVFPVPVQASLTILLATPVNETVTVSIIDLKGQVLQHEKVSVSAGSNTVLINAAHLQSGAYFLRIYSEQQGQSHLQKFLKL